MLGLAGPGKKISGIMPCTVIRPGDMADRILDLIVLAAMAAGMLVTNVSRRNHRILETLERLSGPMYAAFFAIAGAELAFDDGAARRKRAAENIEPGILHVSRRHDELVAFLRPRVSQSIRSPLESAIHSTRPSPPISSTR